MVSLKHVAQRAGVSAGAVSAVLTGKMSVIKVSPETEKRILNAARELNYHPNVSARSLRTGQSYLIGMILPVIGKGIVSEIVQGAEDTLLESEFGLILSTYSTSEDLRRKICFMHEKNIDGAIVLPLPGDNNVFNQYHELCKTKPVVCVAGVDPGYKANRVYTNAQEIGYFAAKHLLELGHRDIVYFSRNSERVNGYRKAMNEYGVSLTKEYSRVFTNDFAQTEYAFQYFLNMKKRPTAAIFFSDLEAAAFISMMCLNGFSVPDDLSVVGTDDDVFSSVFNPPLTTIGQQNRRQGSEAASMILSLIRGEKVSHTMVIEPELIQRKSTKLFYKQ